MIASIWGIEGSGKSTVALTYPKPLFHFEFDIGGFERAIWRVVKESEKEGIPCRVKYCERGEDLSKINWDEWDIVTKPYPVPVQLDRMMGVQQKPGVSVRFPRQIKGVKELWQETVVDLVELCNARPLKTIVVDSNTQHWWICHNSLLQEKQEIQMGKGMKPENDLFRESLKPVEFPNERMRSLIYTAKSSGKHLIMTHYPKDVYVDKLVGERVESVRSGEVTPDGFKHTVTLDDIVLWTYTEIDKQRKITDTTTGPNFGKEKENPNYNKPQPFARISLKCGLSGMGMSAVGLELPAPSYEGLMELQSMMKGE